MIVYNHMKFYTQKELNILHKDYTNELQKRYVEQSTRDERVSYYNPDLDEALRGTAIPFFHAPHVSQKDKTLISYYRSIANFLNDRSTPVRLGKYLNMISKDTFDEEGVDNSFLSPMEIRDRSEKYNTSDEEITLLITNDEDEIWTIYTGGIRSCMANATEYPVAWRNKSVQVYASPDVRVAGLYKGSRLIARAVLNHKQMQYSHIYSFSGYSSEMKERLAGLGYYRNDHGLAGCRIAKIYSEDDSDYFVIPYIDGYYYEVYEHDDDSDYLYIDYEESGYHHDSDMELIIDSQITDGTTGPAHYCEWCESSVHEDTLHYVDSHGSICESCLEDNFVYGINNSYGGEGYIPIGDTIHDGNGQPYLDSVIDDLCYFEDDTEEYYPKDDCEYDDVLDQWYECSRYLLDDVIHHGESVQSAISKHPPEDVYVNVITGDVHIIEGGPDEHEYPSPYVSYESHMLEELYDVSNIREFINTHYRITPESVRSQVYLSGVPSLYAKMLGYTDFWSFNRDIDEKWLGIFNMVYDSMYRVIKEEEVNVA